MLPGNNVNRITEDNSNNFISSKDYYNEYDSQSDSSDDSVSGESIKGNKLVSEINSDNENDFKCKYSEPPLKQQLWQQDFITEFTSEENSECRPKVNHEYTVDRIVDTSKNKELNEVTNHERSTEAYTDDIQIAYSNNSTEATPYNKNTFVSEINCVSHKLNSELSKKDTELNSVLNNDANNKGDNN